MVAGQHIAIAHLPLCVCVYMHVCVRARASVRVEEDSARLVLFV